MLIVKSTFVFMVPPDSQSKSPWVALFRNAGAGVSADLTECMHGKPVEAFDGVSGVVEDLEKAINSGQFENEGD